MAQPTTNHDTAARVIHPQGETRTRESTSVASGGADDYELVEAPGGFDYPRGFELDDEFKREFTERYRKSRKEAFTAAGA